MIPVTQGILNSGGRTALVFLFWFYADASLPTENGILQSPLFRLQRLLIFKVHWQFHLWYCVQSENRWALPRKQELDFPIIVQKYELTFPMQIKLPCASCELAENSV